tara:strand:+ start:6063 stop:8615 length:2553 start_codon:yes stop_codon:yes gene_type:complete
MANLNVGITATDKTGKAFNAVNRNVQALEKGFGSLKGVIAGAFAVGSITAFTNKMLDFADRVHKVSLQVGLGAEALQKFQFAGEQSGVSAEKLNKSLQKLAINAGKATDGSKVQAEAFEKLGVQITDVNGVAIPLEEILFKVATGIKNLKDPTEKAETAVRLFGGAGAELLPFLNEGESGLRLLGKQLEAYGGVLTQDAIDQSAAFNDEINKLSKTFRVIFGEVVLPIVNKAFLGLKRLFLLATTGDPFSLMEKSTKTLQKEVNALLKRNEELNVIFKKQAQALKNQNLKHYERENITKNALRTDKERLENIEKITAIQEILNLKTGTTAIDFAEIDKNVAKAKQNLEATVKPVSDIKEVQLEVVELVGEVNKEYSNLIEHTIALEEAQVEVVNLTKQGGQEYQRFSEVTLEVVDHVLEVVDLTSTLKDNTVGVEEHTINIAQQYVNVDRLASEAIKKAQEWEEKHLEVVNLSGKYQTQSKTITEETILTVDAMLEVVDLTNKTAEAQGRFTEMTIEVNQELIDEQNTYQFILDTATKLNAVTSKFSKSLSGNKTQLADMADFMTTMVTGIKAGAGAVGDFVGKHGSAIAKAGGKSGQRAMNVGKAFAEGGIQEGMMALILSNEKVQEALGKVFDALFELIDPIIDLLAPVIESLVEILVELKPLFEVFVPLLREQLKLLRPLINALKFVAGILGKVGTFLQSLKSPLEVLKAPLIALKSAIDALASPINALKNAIDRIGNIGGGGSGNPVTNTINKVVNTVKKILPFADGGSVRGGRTILVGEKGPELFTPPSNGTIIPNHELGGGQTVVNVYLDMEGQVKLPLHQYISSVVNNANRSGQPELATVLAG